MSNTLTITILPSTANTRGAKWYCSGADGWHLSGEAVTLSAGTYTITYKRVEGYITPADESVTIISSNIAYTTTYSSYQWVSSWGPPISACYFRGQIITGGHVMASPEPFPAPGRVVRWSDIGSFAFLGGTADPRRNEAGEWSLPGNNDEMIMRVLPTEQSVLVYGTYSIWEMTPVKDPVPGFSFKKLWGIGIANPLAVAASPDGRKHLFVDRRGYLTSIGLDQYKNHVPKRLGYNEFFESMQDDLSISTGVGVIVVSYNIDEEEWYISGRDRSFLYLESGLTEIDKVISSVVSIKGSSAAPFPSSIFSDDPIGAYSTLIIKDQLYFETDVIDFNMSAIKTIESIEIGGALGYGNFTEVMVKWRNNRGMSFRETKWKRCSPNGVVFPLVSGSDFIVCLRSTPIEDIQMSNITIGWKLSDKSSVRGSDAGSTST